MVVCGYDELGTAEESCPVESIVRLSDGDSLSLIFACPMRWAIGVNATRSMPFQPYELIHFASKRNEMQGCERNSTKKSRYFELRSALIIGLSLGNNGLKRTMLISRASDIVSRYMIDRLR